jgi:hypothetical protein
MGSDKEKWTQDMIADQLVALLEESLSAATTREQTAYDCATTPVKERVVPYGAGRLGRQTLE